ncbi:MAG: hypothetical protein N2513_08620 [Deltaproteobacteria bacterium]|nr:hypothetical protein [Deltaproteobacteria bacterium]
MNFREPKVLGFYREDGDEMMQGELKGDGEGLYVELPSGFRNRMEIVVGNKIKFSLEAIVDKKGNVLREIKREMVGEVIGYWNELHIPHQEIVECGLKKGDIVRIYLKSVVQFGEEKKV